MENFWLNRCQTSFYSYLILRKLGFQLKRGKKYVLLCSLPCYNYLLGNDSLFPAFPVLSVYKVNIDARTDIDKKN